MRDGGRGRMTATGSVKDWIAERFKHMQDRVQNKPWQLGLSSTGQGREKFSSDVLEFQCLLIVYSQVLMP